MQYPLTFYIRYDTLLYNMRIVIHKTKHIEYVFYSNYCRSGEIYTEYTTVTNVPSKSRERVTCTKTYSDYQYYYKFYMNNIEGMSSLDKYKEEYNSNSYYNNGLYKFKERVIAGGKIIQLAIYFPPIS